MARNVRPNVRLVAGHGSGPCVFSCMRWHGVEHLATYGGETAYTLSVMTHREQSWKVARGALPDGEPRVGEIELDSMAEYYGGLVAPE